MSTMHQVNVNISQKFFISLIFFLFFNASLIKKCKALEIKIKMLNFVNNINILIYERFCYKHIKINKTKQDWSFNQFAVNASEFSV